MCAVTMGAMVFQYSPCVMKYTHFSGCILFNWNNKTVLFFMFLVICTFLSCTITRLRSVVATLLVSHYNVFDCIFVRFSKAVNTLAGSWCKKVSHGPPHIVGHKINRVGSFLFDPLFLRPWDFHFWNQSGIRCERYSWAPLGLSFLILETEIKSN